MVSDEIIKLILETKGVEGLKILATAAQEAADKMEIAGHASEGMETKTVKSSANSGRSVLELGRILQDFSQGGVAGVINNVEGLVTSLGGTAGLAGALTAVGVALFVLQPYIKTFLDSIGEAKTKIPETTGNIEAMTAAYAKNKKELEELKEKQRLTADELSRFNDLTKEQVKLQQQQENARAAASVTADDTDQNRRRGSAFRKAVGQFGGGQALVETLVGMGYEKATAEDIVAGGLKGREGDVGAATLASKKFAGIYDPMSPETEDRNKLKENSLDIASQFDAARMDRYEKRVAEAKKIEQQKKAEQDKADRETERLKEQSRDAEAAKLKGNVKMVSDKTNIDEYATQALAQMTDEGGRRNEFTGALIPMNKEQIEAYTKALIQRELKRAYPQSSAKGRADVAEGIFGDVSKAVGQTQIDAAAQAGQQGLNTNQAQKESLVALFNNTEAKLRAQQAEFMRITQQIEQNTTQVNMARTK